jgi:hypothetical protein
MFVDLEASDGLLTWLRSLTNYFRRKLGLRVRGSLMEPGRRAPRLELAERTFPGLSEHARKFGLWRRWFVRLTLFTVFMTCLVYWDAGHGRAALERLDQDWKAQLETVTNNPLLQRCEDLQTNPIANPSIAALQKELETLVDAGAGTTPLEVAKALLDCKKFNYARWLSADEGKEVKSVFECEEGPASASGFSLIHVFHAWCWRWLLSGYYEPIEMSSTSSNQLNQQSSYGLSSYVQDNATYWQNATLLWQCIVHLYCL